MSIKTIMSRHVLTVELDDTLKLVREIFERTNFHHVLVVENNKLLGVVSDRDLLKALSPNIGLLCEKPSDTATLNKRVHQIMSRHPISLSEHESISKAIELFEQNSISCIPVVDGNEVPVGIVSWRDIFKVIKKKEK